MNELTKQLNSLQIQIDELKNKISFFTQQLKNVAKSMATIAQNFNYERESLAFDNEKACKLSAEKLRALADIPVLDFVSDHFEDTPKPITIDGVQYNLVPVTSTQEVTKENKFKIGDLVKIKNSGIHPIICRVTLINPDLVLVHAGIEFICKPSNIEIIN